MFGIFSISAISGSLLITVGGLTNIISGAWCEELCKGNVAQFQYNGYFLHDFNGVGNDVLEVG